jgi:hypothetical protein
VQALEFLEATSTREMVLLDRALALIWWAGRDDPTQGISAREICTLLEASGFPKQNSSRLHRALEADRRASKAGSEAWRLHPRARALLEGEYGSLRTSRPRPRPTDSVLPRELFVGTRGYLERVVFQVNASYDATLYDCCAVMCRRVLETLIIEVYEHAGRAAEIKGPDGHFFMFAGLLAAFDGDSAFNPSRNAMRGLRDFKSLGDLSAHTRRFTARKDDIDRIRDGLRVAAEELLHLAGLVSGDAATGAD